MSKYLEWIREVSVRGSNDLWHRQIMMRQADYTPPKKHYNTRLGTSRGIN
jgi:hypothetical protein